MMVQVYDALGRDMSSTSECTAILYLVLRTVSDVDACDALKLTSVRLLVDRASGYILYRLSRSCEDDQHVSQDRGVERGG